ncbi:universal stress protein [Paenibacillus sp. IB182496]|uniref:Universal stress protein n=1 Tax=Paenibacillus sabuli TaxID=2772509 RepID=A0A927BSB9_9BACL|nr:universal stress protein [Paenibacillus sabuli]MBD2845392.1 universal stress protein [Paenibacillus sabuli]
MYRRILLAADGSRYAVRAAEEAAKIYRLAGDATVEVLYVADLSNIKGEVLEARTHAEIQRKRMDKLGPIVEVLDNAQVVYNVSIIPGDPGPTIVDYANRHVFDLVLIGSRGLNRFQEFVLGSVSHKVVKRVQCPVMVVK